MRRRTVWIPLVIAALAVVAVLLIRSIAPGQPEPSQPSGQQRPPTVRTRPAVREVVSVALELTGSVEPYHLARLAGPAEGPVTDLRVREGDRVRTGDPLLSIGRRTGVDALIVSLQEELKKEQDNLRRTQQLVEREAVPAEQLDQATVAVERVRAQLVQAEERAHDYAIAAPWDGVVSHVLVKEGEFAASRMPLLEMYDPSSLVIQASVPERHAAEVRRGMRVEVRLDAYPTETMSGRIDRVYPYLDLASRTRTMEIALDESVDLLPGMFARLRVLLETADEAVVVPLEAIVATPGGKAVYVVEEGKAVRRPVQTGIENGNRIEIVAGVRPGDQVIFAGNENLRDGAAVSLSDAKKAGDARNPDTASQSGQQKPRRGDEPR